MFSFETLKYFMISTSFTTLMMGFILILLFKQSKQRYMMFWGLALVAYCLMFLIDFSYIGTNAKYYLYILYRQFFSLFSSSLILIGTYNFFGKKISEKFLVSFVVFTVLLFLCLLSQTIYHILLIPLIIFCSFTLICAGILFNINHNPNENMEEYLLSLMIILWSVYSNNFPFTTGTLALAISNYFISLVLLNSIVILLIIVHFKINRLALSKQEAHYRMLVENASGLIFLYDHSTQKFEYISPYASAVFGLGFNDLYDNPFIILENLDEDDRQKMSDLLFNPSECPTNFVFKLYRNRSPYRWYELYSTPIFNELFIKSGVEFVIRDVTARVETEKNLERSEKAREALIEDISHELRTPATLIQGYSESLLNGDVTADNFQSYVKIIHAKIITLNALLEDLLQASKFTSQSIEYKFYEHNAAAFFKKILNEYEIFIQNENHRFTCVNEIEDEYFIIADEYRIGQVFANVVHNALKYSEENTFINIVCANKNDKIQIEISDNGMGIPSNDLPHIFGRKYRGSSSQSGFGLGLYISNEIIRQHGGKIWAKNNSKRGSTFYFTIPCYCSPHQTPS